MLIIGICGASGSGVFKNYNAKTQGYKELYLVEGAVHANAYAKDPANYTWRVKYFLDRVKSGEIK